MKLWAVEHFFLSLLGGCNSKPTQKWWQICSTAQSFIRKKSNFLQNPYFSLAAHFLIHSMHDAYLPCEVPHNRPAMGLNPFGTRMISNASFLSINTAVNNSSGWIVLTEKQGSCPEVIRIAKAWRQSFFTLQWIVAWKYMQMLIQNYF